MRSISSTLSLTSLFILGTAISSASADDSNLSHDCGLFAINGAGFNNAGNFQLAAFEESAANDSAVPLVLEINPRLHFLSVVDLDLVSPTVFALQDGTLYANDTANIVEVANPVFNGSIVSFFRAPGQILASQFCALANTDPAGGSPDPTLALLGDADSFSICKTNSTPPTSAVVYNATAHSQSYNIKDCTQVQIRLLPPS